MDEEQRINLCKTSVSHIYAMLRSSPHTWHRFCNLARSVIAHIDATTFMQQTTRTAEQTWVIAGLQRLAEVDADNGTAPDILAWCSRQWLAIHQREPFNVIALRGIGQAWATRAQPTLSRINQSEGGSSSSGGSSQQSSSTGTSDDSRQSEAERRSGTADHVEARGYLQPAIEYLDRAVAAAQAQNILSGELLVAAVEAYLSLGNISSPRVNERYFQRAVQLLRAASRISDFTLNPHLQQYLDDYGRLFE